MPDEQKPESELKFPLTWDKCPVCGSTERVADKIREEKIAAGKWRPELAACIQQWIVPFIDPVKTPMFPGITKVTVLSVLVDICANPKCGAIYCKKIEMQETIPQGGPGHQPTMKPFGFPGGNIKGN